MIIVVCIIAIAILLVISNNKKGKIKLLKVFDKLEKYDGFDALHEKLLSKISLFVANYETASSYVYLSIVIYIFIAIAATLLFSFSNFVWYVKAINICLNADTPLHCYKDSY